MGRDCGVEKLMSFLSKTQKKVWRLKIVVGKDTPSAPHSSSLSANEKVTINNLEPNNTPIDKRDPPLNETQVIVPLHIADPITESSPTAKFMPPNTSDVDQVFDVSNVQPVGRTLALVLHFSVLASSAHPLDLAIILHSTSFPLGRNKSSERKQASLSDLENGEVSPWEIIFQQLCSFHTYFNFHFSYLRVLNIPNSRSPGSLSRRRIILFFQKQLPPGLKRPNSLWLFMINVLIWNVRRRLISLLATFLKKLICVHRISLLLLSEPMVDASKIKTIYLLLVFLIVLFISMISCGYFGDMDFWRLFFLNQINIYMSNCLIHHFLVLVLLYFSVPRAHG